MSQRNDWFVYTSVMNALLANHPPRNKMSLLKHYAVPLDFDLSDFSLCLTGLKKSVYHDVYGVNAEDYITFCRGLLIESLLFRFGFSGNAFMVLQDNSKQIIILYCRMPGTAMSCQDMAQIITQHIQQAYEQAFFKGDTRYANVSSLVQDLTGLEAIPEAFSLARQLNDMSFFSMKSVVITEAMAKSLQRDESYLVIFDQFYALKNAMESGDCKATLDIADDLFLNKLKNSYSLSLCRDTLSYLKHLFILYEGVYHLPMPDNWDSLCDAAGHITIEACYAAIRGIIQSICSYIGKHGVFSGSVLLSLYYINVHFNDPGLTRFDVAHFARSNANYLSSTFRREVGVGIRQYITKKRMECAKQLLDKGNWKISDVALQVGIENPKYFTHLFKEYFGILPTQINKRREI